MTRRIIVRVCDWLLTVSFAVLLTGGCASEPRHTQTVPATADGAGAARHVRPLSIRMRAQQLRNPYWYSENGKPEEARQFWDMAYWEGVFATLAAEGYNAVLYLPEPWQEHSWQTFLIRHEEFPEARDLSAEQYDRVIAQTRRILARARAHGLRNFFWSYFVVTTRAFAAAHGMDGQMPVSEQVDYRHNLAGQTGPHFGVRNELTRAFTEAAVAEVFRTYPELDGLCGGMGEAVPGKRSTWYRQAIVPGLKRCGRNPVFILDDWMLPLDDFVADVARDLPYENTWLSIKANGEVFTDAQPYPDALRWAREARKAGIPVLFQVMNLNIEANFPFNSPRLAQEVIEEFASVPNCVGCVAWFLDSNPNTLFRHALGHYGRTGEPYSPDRWVGLLAARYGDRGAAEHLLRAFDASARIPADLCAFAWLPQDIGRSQILTLPYWHWTLEDPRWGYLTSPARGADLLPLRHYAQVVARHGERFRDNSGADHGRNSEHPGAQELIWGLTRYPTTPEAHLRAIRRLGEECATEADAAMPAVRAQHDEARVVRNYMEAYRLLTLYYEQKVLAAAAALTHGFGGGVAYRADAERHADAAVERYRDAVEFIVREIDAGKGTIRGRWGGSLSLAELVENEKRERERLPELFHWRDADVTSSAAPAR